MAQIKKVVARKNYPQFGIERGQEHYVWSFYGTGSIRSLKPPKPSQLTSSDTLRTLLEVLEFIDEADDSLFTPDQLREWAQQLEDGQNSADESFENLSDGLQVGTLGERFQQWSEAAEELRSELEEIADELEEYDESENDDDIADAIRRARKAGSNTVFE